MKYGRDHDEELEEAGKALVVEFGQVGPEVGADGPPESQSYESAIHEAGHQAGQAVRAVLQLLRPLVHWQVRRR